MQAPFPVLILGGTTEANELAARLAGCAPYAPVLSFAGRTRNLRLPAIPHRVGGFGGAEGLAGYLRAEHVRAVVDATHPFAARISANAHTACRDTGVPLAIFTRPPWQRVAGDCWIEVSDLHSAATALSTEPRNIFLTVGRQDLSAFRTGPPHRYLVRTVDPVSADQLPVNARLILSRGPFEIANELQLLREHAIDIIVTKNSGGAATYAKIVAARQLSLPVVVVQRPNGASGTVFTNVEDVMEWLEAEQRMVHHTAP